MNSGRHHAPAMGRRQMLLGAAAALAGCAETSAPIPSPRPAPLDTDPLAGIRLLADAPSATWSRHLNAGRVPSPTVLALSGGGEDGAFGAGGLVGWSHSGTRPDFDIVTGVSTGALIAPFAFLGPEHDATLRRIFTQHDADDIMRLRPVQAVFNEALYDTTPLARLIARFTPHALLDAVAERHARGARLFIVTSELDTARASVWDMGAIAQAGQYHLFRAIMRASSALPGLFPPVQLQYTADGVTWSETHLDGGVHMQFMAPPGAAFPGGGALYVLVNNTLNPAPAQVSRTAMAISQQALTTSIRASAATEVEATRLFARINGVKLSVAAVAPDSGVVWDPSDRFSSDYMNALYRHGYERGLNGTLWHRL